MRTCHVATSCGTRDDLISALAPFVEGNAVFIPGRIPLEPGDVVKLNLSLREGPVVFSGTFEARAIYREGTGVMGKAGVLFLVRRLDEPSQAVHQQLLRRKRELASGGRPASLSRTLYGRPAELPTPGPSSKTPGPQSVTPGPVAHTPAPVLVTPQTPKPGSLPAPTVNPFAEMTTNAIDFFVEATLTEDSAGAGAGPTGGEATTETPPPDFLGLPVPGARKTLALSSPVNVAGPAPAARTPGPVVAPPPKPAPARPPASGLSATVAAPLPRVSGTAATIASPLPRPLSTGIPSAKPAAAAVPPVPGAASATPSPAASKTPPPRPVTSPPPAAPMAGPSSGAATVPAAGAPRITPAETPPPIALSSARSQEMEELPEEEIHTLLTPVQRRWRAIRRFLSGLLPRRSDPRAVTAERRPGRPRWVWVGLASAGVGVIAFLLLSGKPATNVPVATTTVAPGPSVAPLPGPEERSIPTPAPAAAPVAARPAPAAAPPAPAAPPERPAPPAAAPAPAPAPRAAARAAAAPSGSAGCTADIESTPRAEVEVAGRLLGRTPLRGAAVPCGDSSLTISHPRYRRVTRSLTASPGTRAQVEARLQRPSAQLQLSPASAAWKVNGRALPAGTQSYEVLRFETVKVEARLSGQKTWRRKLYVKTPVTRLNAR